MKKRIKIARKIGRKSLIALITFVLVILPVTLLVIFTQAKTASAVWFDDNYFYRKAITVTVNSSSSDIVNLDTLLTVDTTGITANLQTNCEDLRFTSVNGNILPYYAPSCSDNSATNKVWVQVDLVPKNTTTYTMYMYYGNPTAGAGSNATLFNLYNSLAGYWTMNQSSWANDCSTTSVTDSSVNAINGIPCPNASAASITTGKYANGGNFDGTADYITMGDPASGALDFGTGDFTVSTWFNASSAVTGTNRWILGKYGTGFSNSYSIIQTSTDILQFHVLNGTTEIDANAASDYNDDAWHHAVGVRSGDNLYLYVDGALVGSNTGVDNYDVSSTAEFRLGGRFGGGGGGSLFFTGKLDEARAYSRALSAGEVSQLYSSTPSILTTDSPTIGPSTSFAAEEKGPSPVAYWKFDDATGTNANDSTSNNIDGTISGATWQTEDQCVAGKCLYFDGSNDYVAKASPSFIDDTKGTVSSWVRFSGATQDAIIWSISTDGSTDDEYRLNFDGSDSQKLAIYLIANGVNTLKLTAASAITDTNWHYVTVTSDASTIKLYVDGVPKTLTAAAGSNTGQWFSSATDANVFSVGILQRATDLNPLKGFEDEVKVDNYDRSAAQILTDYNARSNLEGASSQVSQLPNNDPAALNNGLVTYWKMDQTSWDGTAGEIIDSSGNGNGGAAKNSASTTTGKFNYGGNFNLSSKYAQMPYISTFNDGDFSISTWIKANAISRFNPFFTIRDATSIDRAVEFSILPDNTVRVSFYSDDHATTQTVAASTWYHLSTTFNRSTKELKIYINGALVKTSTTTGVPTVTSGGLTGNGIQLAGITASSEYADVVMDETRVYNRILSPADMANLYNFAPGPAAYWAMEAGTGTTITDSSGNANTSSAFTGNVAWTTGKYGKGLKFDGDGDVVRIVESTSTDLGATTSSYATSAWFKTTTNYATDGTLVGKLTAAPYPYDLYIDASEHACFAISDGTNTPFICGSTALNDGVWHYASGVRDVANDKLLVYVDGVLVGSTTDTTTATTANNADVSIGNSGTSYVDYDFNGSIDEARIYNYAITPQKIVSDMNAGQPGVGSPVGSAVGHWKFDEGSDGTCTGGTNDTCNSGNQGSTLDGAISGMAVPATAASGWTNGGKFSRALVFDGTNDYISTGNQTATNFSGTLPFTITAWINPDTISGEDAIFSKFNAGVSGEYIFELNDGKLYFHREFNSPPYHVQGSTTLSTGTWYHVAAVYDGTNMQVFLNGIADSATKTSGSVTSTSNDVLIGAYLSSSTPAFFFDGTIDEVKVYDYGLTAAQLKVDMNRGSAQVSGALSDKSTYPVQAANQEYCIPGDSTSCAAPVGRWDFEQGTGSSVFDTSSQGNTGTWSGTLGAQWTPGKVGKGGKFNGTDNFVDAGAATVLDFTDAFSVEAWFYVTDPTGSTSQFIVSKDNSSGARGWGLKVGASKLLLEKGGANQMTGATTLSANTWYHGAATYDGSGNYYLYLNGVQDASSTGGSDVSSNTSAKLEIGARQYSGAENYLGGKIDQARVYNYKRSAAQIAWDYNNGAPIAHWKFDECQGSVANNSAAGSLYPGTITVGASSTYTSVGTCASSSASTMWYNGRTGKFNYSLAFDGDDDYVVVAHNSVFDFTNEIYTLSTWIKPSSLATAYIFAKDAGTNGYGVYIDTDGSVQHVQAGNTALSTPQGVISTGNWYHIVASSDGTNKYIYVNGVLMGTAVVRSITDTAGALYIGQGESGAFNFTGQIDDPRVYNYAMTTTQVKTLMNQGGAGRYGPVTGAP